MRLTHVGGEHAGTVPSGCNERLAAFTGHKDGRRMHALPQEPVNTAPFSKCYERRAVVQVVQETAGDGDELLQKLVGANLVCQISIYDICARQI